MLIRLHKKHQNTMGFTLIELMIAIAIVAILASVALPSYQRFVQKSIMRTAQADLVALSLALENNYQRTLSYSTFDNANYATLTDEQKKPISTWAPAVKDSNYTFTIDSGADKDPADGGPGYLITANGVAGSKMAGCNLTLDSKNTRAVQAGCTIATEWF